ncbi:MAG: glycosyltransferase family 2 protein [Bacteroidales bacterium]|nr:glycosyltransferase family 2 protein [Bacteroidales bacterium]
MENDIDLEQKYNQAIKQLDHYKAKANAAEVAFQGCRTSSSYKLGHLLIHDTKSIKDILKLPGRIKAIKNSSSNMTIKRPSSHSSNKKKGEAVSDLPSQKKDTYQKGISIILPTYKGEKTILRVLSSLAKQDMQSDLFEIIIVINGEKDNTENIINEFSKTNINLNIHIITLAESGASLARNKGLEEASYQYTLLIDDDDAVSTTYLSSMYKLASENTIVCSQIINIEGDHIDSSNLINMQILNAETPVNTPYATLPSILAINACKLLPTHYMKQIKFDTCLNSGEDIVYFSELYSKFSFNFTIAKEAIYFRFIKQNSVSRQPLSFEFNVIGRLLTISGIIKAIDNDPHKSVKKYLLQLINSQINFINAYLREYPDEYQKVVEEIGKRELSSFPFEKLVGYSEVL